MRAELSENEIKTLIIYNLKKSKTDHTCRHITLTKPYIYWVDEFGDGTSFHCAYCGYKSDRELDECPECGSKAIQDFGYTEFHRYISELNNRGY